MLGCVFIQNNTELRSFRAFVYLFVRSAVLSSAGLENSCGSGPIGVIWWSRVERTRSWLALDILAKLPVMAGHSYGSNERMASNQKSAHHRKSSSHWLFRERAACKQTSPRSSVGSLALIGRNLPVTWRHNCSDALLNIYLLLFTAFGTKVNFCHSIYF